VRSYRILISILGLAILAAPVWATSTIIYTDQTAFNNATSSVFFQNITFDASNLSSSTGYTDPSGVNFTDSFTGDGSRLSVSGGNLVDTNSWGFAAALPNVVYDYWFTVTGSAGEALNVAFTAPDGYQHNTYSLGSGTFFFGVTSSAPITGLSFTNSSGHQALTITGFGFAGTSDSGGGGDPGDAPEGATLLLIGSGLIAMRFLRKRDKTRAGARPKTSASPAEYISPQIAAS